MHELWLVAVGLFVGSIGSMVGAGGGFLLMPYLLMAENMDAKAAAAVSMCAVFFNALSGSAAYFRQKRVDAKAGLCCLASAVPGSLLGARLTPYFGGQSFRFVFGILLLLVVYRMLAGSVFPKWLREKFEKKREFFEKGERRALTDVFGQTHEYRFPLKNGVAASFFVGVYSGVFGIGGGILHVPLMADVFGFPFQIAAGTSQFVLAVTAFATVAQNAAMGSVDYGKAVFLSIGAAAGAQIGVRLSSKIDPLKLKKALSACLVAVALKMMLF